MKLMIRVTLCTTMLLLTGCQTAATKNEPSASSNSTNPSQTLKMFVYQDKHSAQPEDSRSGHFIAFPYADTDTDNSKIPVLLYQN